MPSSSVLQIIPDKSTEFAGLSISVAAPIFTGCKLPSISHQSSRGRQDTAAGLCFSPLTSGSASKHSGLGRVPHANRQDCARIYNRCVSVGESRCRRAMLCRKISGRLSRCCKSAVFLTGKWFLQILRCGSDLFWPSQIAPVVFVCTKAQDLFSLSG